MKSTEKQLEQKKLKYEALKSNPQSYSNHLEKNRNKLQELKKDPVAYDAYLANQKEYRLKYKSSLNQDESKLNKAIAKRKIYKITSLAKIKQDPVRLQHFTNYNQEYKKQYKANLKINDPFHLRYLDLLQKSKNENVKCNITKDELVAKLKTEKCYLTGQKIIKDLDKTTYAYYLDRIGKPEHGGNGLGGGDYVWDNVKVCVFNANQLRSTLNLTTAKAQILFYPYRLYSNTKDFIKNILKKLF